MTSQSWLTFKSPTMWLLLWSAWVISYHLGYFWEWLLPSLWGKRAYFIFTGALLWAKISKLRHLITAPCSFRHFRVTTQSVWPHRWYAQGQRFAAGNVQTNEIKTE